MPVSRNQKFLYGFLIFTGLFGSVETWRYRKNAPMLTPDEFEEGILRHSSTVEGFQEYLGDVTMGTSRYATGPEDLKTLMRTDRKPGAGGTGEVVLKPGVEAGEVEWFLSIDCSDKEYWWFPSVKKSYYDILFDSRFRILGYRAVLVQRGSR